MNPDRLRELADDLERYQALPDPQDRASWERAIAVELVADAARPLDDGWVLARERDLEEIARWEPWGRALRFLILPMAVGLAIGLGLSRVVGGVASVLLIVVPAMVWCLWELFGPPAKERARILAELKRAAAGEPPGATRERGM